MPTEMYSKVNIKTTNLTAKGSFGPQTEMSTKVNTKTAIETAEGLKSLPTEMSTKVNSKTSKETEQGSRSYLTGMFTMELGLMTRSMAASNIPTQMVKLIKKSG